MSELTQDNSDFPEVKYTYYLDRMKQYVECETIEMPSYIRNADEIRAWLLHHK